jgi:undecaprenyl pyrophosphate phosphatase UppP
VIWAIHPVTTELPTYDVLLIRVAVSSVILALYAYDFVRVFDQWRDLTDRRRGSSFRALIKSLNLTLGLTIIFLGAITSAFFADDPTIRDGLRFAGYVLLGTLLVGGIALVYSWVQGDPDVA